MDSGKAGQTRKRLDEQSWRAVFERFEGAAMTVQEFCQREGLTRSVFMRWRARLRSSSMPQPIGAVAKTASPASKPSFVDLGLLGSTTTAAGAAGIATATAAAHHMALDHTALDLRIELGAGISLHLVRR
ncbi:MAG: IS66 family insertion sequence element accessory protein TnpA [Rubrivivax sp.]